MLDRPHAEEQYRFWSDLCRAFLIAGVPLFIFVAFGLWLANHVLWFVEKFETAYFKIAYLLMLMDSPQLLRAGGGYATIFFIWLWIVPVALAVMALNDGIRYWRRLRTRRQ